MSSKRELKEVIRRAREQGFEVTLTGSMHYRFKAPNGALVFTGSTPSDRRSIHNAVAQLRRAGFR